MPERGAWLDSDLSTDYDTDGCRDVDEDDDDDNDGITDVVILVKGGPSVGHRLHRPIMTQMGAEI